MLRVEDDALLRGEGRFLDDLAPVARTFHAAVVRSQLAHARIEVDATAALALPGVVGVLTGADVAALSRPFPAGIEIGRAAVRRRDRHGALRRGADRRRRRRATGTSPRMRRSSSRWTTTRSTPCSTRSRQQPTPCTTAASRTATSTARWRRPSSSCAQTFHFPRFTCTPVECYAVVADWDATAGRLTAWANFQGPFTLHGVAAAALGLKGDRLRLLTPPDSGGSFGIKSSVFAYVVLMGLAARHLGVPVTWTEDRLEHLAASAAATGRTTEVEAGFTADGRAARAPLRRDRGRRRLRPRARAGDALPHARLALGRVHRPERRRAEPRRAHEHDPVGSQPRLRRARSSTSGSSGRWRSPPGASGSIPAELARRNLIPAAAMPYRTPSGALYDSGDYAACLDKALELADYDALGARVAALRAEGGLAGIGLACIVEPSISNMGYITLAQTADERALTLPKSGNAEGASIAIDPLGGITVQARLDAAGPGPPHGLRPGRRRRARLRSRGRHRDVRDGHGERALDGRLRQLLLALLRRRRRCRPGGRAQAPREDRRDPRARRRREPLAAPRRGDGALESRGTAGRRGAGACSGRLLGAADARSTRRGGPRCIVGGPRLHRRHLCGRGRPPRRDA